MHRVRIIPFLLVAAFASGCLTIERRVVFDDSYVRTETKDAGTRVDPTTAVSFEPSSTFSGGTIKIQQTSVTKCLTSKTNYYSRREKVLRDYNPREAKLAVAGGFGLSAAGGIFGVVRLNQAPHLSNERVEDPETGEKEPSEREVAFNQGVLGVSLAVPVLAWSMVEAARAMDSSSYVGIIPKDEMIEARDCGAVPLPGLLTMGKSRVIELGRSDANGLVTVDLAQLARTDLLNAEPLFVDGQPAGELRMATPLLEFLRRAGGVSTATKKELAAFVADYPGSFATADATNRLALMVAAENSAFEAAFRGNTREAYEAALAAHPEADSGLREKAVAKLNALAERSAADAVVVWDSQFLNDVTEYGQKSVRFFIHFENRTSKRVVGVLTKVTARNSFGRVVLSETFENEVNLPPQSRERSSAGWIFKDNPFISGEPYDNLWKSVSDGTLAVDIEVQKVILEGGTVLTSKPAKLK